VSLSQRQEWAVHIAGGVSLIAAIILRFTAGRAWSWVAVIAAWVCIAVIRRTRRTAD
jgi:hypothetical protein